MIAHAPSSLASYKRQQGAINHLGFLSPEYAQA
jgi:hypothetical protein